MLITKGVSGSSLETTAIEDLEVKVQCANHVDYFLWSFLVIIWSLTAPGHNMLLLYGKEQHEHATKHLLLCSTDETMLYVF